MSAELPYWLQVSTALLTPAIALAVGAIGWLQWRTNELKRRQDLFETRFEFYKRALSSYEEFHSKHHGTTMPWEFGYFHAEAQFLFGEDIVDHLRHMDRVPKFNVEWFAAPFLKYMQLK